MPHIFYNTQKLSLKNKTKIILEGKEICNEWRVDQLDCSVSQSRQQIDMLFEDIMEKLNNKCHFVIIQRNDLIDGAYGEIGFSTLNIEIDYFLWIYIGVDKFNELVKKYKLKIK